MAPNGTSQPKPNAGRRLLHTVVDELAQSEPERVLYSVAKTKDPSDGFLDITAQAFAHAVDRCAWHIEKNLGRGANFPTLTYLGPQDLVYGIVVLACVKTGYKVLLSSPRNTLETHLALLDQTDCGAFLLPPNFPLPVVKQILAARQLRVLEIPGTAHWIDDSNDGAGFVPPYPYTKTFDQAKPEPFVVLHTSGSTGIPKPVVQTHATQSPLDALTDLSSLGLAPVYPAMCAGTRVYLGFPLFHCAGISMLLPGALYSGFTVVLGPFPPSADVLNAIHVHGNVQHSCVVPTQLIDLANDPEHLDNLARLSLVTYGGGPLPRAVGDLISTKTRLLNCLGSTECGILPHQLCDSEDWAYMKPSPAVNAEFRRVSDNLYEQVIVRKPELERFQGVFATFPELDEWPTKDLYTPHPTKDGAWLYQGRADDIVVFSNGEKLNPLDMESTICAHPSVSAALVAGLGRFQASLLVEAHKPPTTEAEEQALLDAIWPAVEAANKQSPSYGRLHRNMILFTSPDKPMLRAGKGTVQRSLTLQLYAAELDAVYKAAEGTPGPVNGNHSSKPVDEDVSDSDIIKRILRAATEIDVDGFPAEADLLELGLDSLQVTVIARELSRFLAARGRPQQTVQPKMVYAHPTLAGLTALFDALLIGRDSDGTTAQDKIAAETTAQDLEKMRALFAQHTSNLPRPARRPVSSTAATTTTTTTTTTNGSRSTGPVILLTGSTGSLGSHILHALLSNPSIAHVYCLLRGDSDDNEAATARQRAALAARGLPSAPELFTPGTGRVTVLGGASLASPRFGLSPEVYDALLLRRARDPGASSFVVVHCAWRVDFNHGLDSLAGTHVAGVRRVVNFVAEAGRGASVLFVSSVSAVDGYFPGGEMEEEKGEADVEGVNIKEEEKKSGTVFVPEVVLRNWAAAPRGTGYGQSKFVAERVLDAAAREAGIRAVVCRIGQVAGPSPSASPAPDAGGGGGDSGADATSCWPKSEWLPSLVASSKHLGKLPDSLGPLDTVDWVPVDVAGRCVAELASRTAATIDKTDPDGQQVEAAGGAEVYHFANPQRTTWGQLAPTITRYLAGEGTGMELVSLAAWVDALRQSSESGAAEDIVRNPAVKLLDFFVSRVSKGPATLLEVSRTLGAVPWLADIGPVREQWLEHWMRQWSF